MRERRERGSLWGVQRRKEGDGADDNAHDGDASPKAQHLLDLQRSAGNAAVSGAVAQRSIWEDLFGGGASDSTLKAGPQQQDPGSIKGGGGGMQPTVLPGAIKGGGAQPGSIKGGGAPIGPTILGGGEPIMGAKGYEGYEGSKDVEAKGYEGYEGSKDVEAKGYEGYEGSKDIESKGYEGYEGSKDVEAKGYDGYADEGSKLDQEYKDGGSDWGDGPASGEQQQSKAESQWPGGGSGWGDGGQSWDDGGGGGGGGEGASVEQQAMKDEISGGPAIN